MNANEVKNQFLSFLRKNGIVKEYMDNFMNAGRIKSLIELCDNVPTNDIISYSFDWSTSKQGRGFWLHYHKMWSESDKKSFCSKPPDWMMPYSVGHVFSHQELGNLIVSRTSKGLCQGCVFNEKSGCTNGGQYACTPYGRGDGENVIFKKC
jgi:hypothetical protein